MDLDSLIINLRIKENERRNADLNNRYQHLCNKEFTNQIDQQFSSGGVTTMRKLKITYVMNHARVCGGSKIILEHTNHLVKRGHEVTIVCHFPKPDWMEVTANYIQVPFQMNIAQGIPDSDIIVTTVYDQNIDCYLSKIAPIIHFEQGDIYIYDFDKYNSEQQLDWKKHYSLAIPILAVSTGLADAIENNFQRKPQILHNALNSHFFYPRSNIQYNSPNPPRILMVGAEKAAFKGIEVIRKALHIVAQQGYKFEPVWVTPTPPDSKFDGKLVINPSQSELGDIYRSCDIYVSGSFFESFPLPPLEAMSCGCAVVSTENVGIVEYASSGKNSLLTKIGDPEKMAEALTSVLSDEELKNRLVQGGYQTAEHFKWEHIISQLESYLLTVIELWPKSREFNSLRIEHLPRGLSQQEILKRIDSIQMSMQEQWCLWKVEGESICPESLAQIRRVLSDSVDDMFNLQVEYLSEIPDHPVERWEGRLLRKGNNGKNQDSPSRQKLHLKISGGSEGYFLPEWLLKVREFYLTNRYDEIILFLKTVFSSMEEMENPVVLKWLVLALIEKDNLSSAVSILKDCLELYPTFTDNIYLYARIANEMGESFLGKSLFQQASIIGDAADCIEWFGGIKEHCKLYI